MKKCILAIALLASFCSFSEEPPCYAPKGSISEPVLFFGDSMMRILGNQAVKAFKKKGYGDVDSFSSIGSGLARASVFDWNAKIVDLLEKHNPQMVFIAIGSNDRQALEDGNGNTIPYSDRAAWKENYSKLVGGVMDRLMLGGVKTIVWLMPPDMMDKANSEHASLLRTILSEEASTGERKGKIQLLDLRPVLSTTPGKYSRYKMSPTGEALSVRDPDGIHLSVAGAKLVAEAILKEYGK